MKTNISPQTPYWDQKLVKLSGRSEFWVGSRFKFFFQKLYFSNYFLFEKIIKNIILFIILFKLEIKEKLNFLKSKEKDFG